jgi:hypothetical protein
MYDLCTTWHMDLRCMRLNQTSPMDIERYSDRSTIYHMHMDLRCMRLNQTSPVDIESYRDLSSTYRMDRTSLVAGSICVQQHLNVHIKLLKNKPTCINKMNYLCIYLKFLVHFCILFYIERLYFVVTHMAACVIWLLELRYTMLQ